MLNWIKLALGAGGASEKDQRGAQILEPLKQDLERLGKRDASLPAKALEFVLEGTGGDIPGLIRKGRAPHQTWSSGDHDQAARLVRWRLYDHWDELPAQFWIRFGSWSAPYKRWYSATDSGPAGVLGFDPVLRYKTGGPWTGCNSPAQACGANLVLTNARANRAGRLSLSESTQAQE